MILAVVKAAALQFFGAVLPFAGLSLVLLTGALLMRRSAPLPEIPSTAGQLPPARGRLLCYLGLFLLSLAAVAKLIPVLQKQLHKHDGEAEEKRFSQSAP